MQKSVVVLVGRPNVGKSTLFNRLVGQRLAIVDDVPGTTRDRLVAEGDWAGHDFFVVDTGGIDPSKQHSQNPLSIGSADFIQDIREQAEIAMEEANVILLVTDALDGVTQADREVVDILRKRRKSGEQKKPPILLVVNKADSPNARLNAMDFYSLGLGEPYPISAIHGTGTGDLLDAVVELFPTRVEDEEEDDSIKVAIVGKPNAGKSSLLNKITGQPRSIVSNIPGTTRDAIDSKIENEFGRFLIYDTAGLRRKAKVDDQIEYVSALRSRRSVEGAHVSLIMIDADQGPAEQDTKVAGLAHNDGKACIILVNKWDLIDTEEQSMRQYEETIRSRFDFMPYAPVLFISVKTGFNLGQIWPLILRVYESSRRRVSTSVLNEVLAEALVQHPTPQKKGRHLRVYYATQGSVSPPTFIFFVNDKRLLHFSYERYLENRLRENFDFYGTPVRFIWKGRAARDEASSRVTPD